MKKATHRERLLAYFEKHKSITTMQAFNDLGNTRLATYIHNLIKEGYVISKRNKKVTTRYGYETTVTEYTLISKPEGIFGDAVGELNQIIADVFKPFNNVKSGK
tara:strand:+ start:20462 stop:20773 length:312 start_codon:yes stop_codon:yes gene_type:complete